MRGVRQDFEAELVNGPTNHVHPLMQLPPKVALSKRVNSLKGVSSRLLHEKFEDVRVTCRKDVRLRSGSYFAGSADGSLSAVQEYLGR